MANEKKRCRVCGCTDDDYSQCIERTGHPCHWVEEDLCSACTLVMRSEHLRVEISRMKKAPLNARDALLTIMALMSDIALEIEKIKYGGENR